MDDLVLIWLTADDDKVMQALMQDHIHLILGKQENQQIYHQNLKIKLEEDPRGITCLGSLIYEKDNQLHIRYLNKNEEFLHGHEQKNGKILRFQHTASFSPQQQKNGVVIGEFCRVQRLTSDHNDLVEQSLLLAKEMNLLGITSKQLSTIFLRKYKNTNNSVWQLLHDLMKTEHKKL